MWYVAERLMGTKLICLWLGILLLCCCQPSQQKNVPEQGTDTEATTQGNQDETPKTGNTSANAENGSTTHVPDSFKRFIDSLPEWTADTIGTRDIFYCDADITPEYAEKFEMRNRLEEEESISVSPQFMYKVTLEGCYVIFVEKQVLGCTTTDGFYA